LREQGVIAEVDGRWTLARDVPDLRDELPESVRSMIQRKLERLDEADRRLLAAASVQGAEFDAALVAGVLPLDPVDVEERLQTLDRVHGIVRAVREHEFPDRTLTMRFAFVHILYQQALYGGLTPARRTSLSAALARALEARYGEAKGDVAADLAYLYEVGRDFERAAHQFWRAAQNAARVFAHRDAITLARRGLALVSTLPDTPARAGLELPLQTTLGLQLQVTEGFAAPAAARAYHRARELCDRVGDSTHVFPVLWGLWLHAKVRSDLRTAQQRADELHTLARRLNDPDLALQAHQALGVTALCYGAPTSALRHVEQAAALYDPARHRTHSFLFGQDPGIICKAYGAVVLWLLGYPEQAQRQSEAAIDASRELSPSSQAVALHFAAMLHQMRRDAERVRACTDQSCAIAAEHGFSFWLAGGNVLGGWAEAASGHAEPGLERLRDGLRNWAATDSVTYQTYYLGLLAEVLNGQDRPGDALTILDEALALARQTDEGLYEAELHRLRGEAVLRAHARVASAETDFRSALELARRRDARALQLRAAVSLARLWKDTGAPADAPARLRESYSFFTEGFDTPELRDARTLCP
jgi:adenylate cyclase